MFDSFQKYQFLVGVADDAVSFIRMDARGAFRLGRNHGNASEATDNIMNIVIIGIRFFEDRIERDFNH